uniref:Uncharacterized protein n=1 Tax=Clastoptera arizonana TaxID=38151 RepID=A0A1B6DNR8_9HEMI
MFYHFALICLVYLIIHLTSQILFLINQKDLKSFMNRLKNTFLNIYYKHCYEQRHVSTSNQLAKKYLGENTPPLQELTKRTSIFLLNTHHNLRKAWPFPPQGIKVAGLHVKPIKTLPKVS